ncbi:MFS transporter [Hymenobacter aquaticus]|uniref:MFS transporter n=1 Tax=Hymenobacter aquaticus TaxID=1867101 RepID=A0A4Z0PWG9_9BACT|nr:MFS transporter [Hymenobacter aquaticus]TGE21301.1 MFS transporter [Hymenobacter aquaticus]
MGKTKLLPLALGGLAIGTTEFVMMGLLPNIAAEFRVTIPQAGYVISGYALGVVIGAPLLAVVGGGVPPKKMLMLLMLLFAGFNTLSAFAPNNTVLFITRLLSGLPHGAFFGVGSVVASRLAAQGKQAQAISIMFAGLTVANLLMVPIGTYVGHHYSWRYTLAGVGLIGLLTVLAVQLVLPALEAEQNGSVKSQLAAFNKLETWLIVLLTAIGTGGLFCWISYIAPLLTDVSGFAPEQVPYMLMVAGLGMVVGNVAGGKLADKLSPLNACLVLLLTMAATLLGIYFVAESRLLSVLMTFVAGGCSLAVAAPIQIMMIHASKGAETLGASVTQAAFNIGNALGAFLGGLPIAAGYGYTSPALVGVGMALAGAGFALALIRLKASQAQPAPVAQVVAG